jgi:1,4-alpha-glucan branching enzyme
MSQSGRLELLGGAATHAVLPLLLEQPASLRAQVELGCQAHERRFGVRPTGFWLPECAWSPALEPVLHEAGVRRVVLETQALTRARPTPPAAVFTPVVTPSGLVAFGRDQESSRQVWSKVEGYPGDPWYRDFYRDVGYDLDYEYIRPYLNPFGERGAVGVKYYRITGAGDTKLPYDPGMARVRAAEHAANFLFNREKQAEWVAGSMDGVAPLLLAPYDAELFGHWWYEGPIWLEEVFRQAALRPQGVVLTTPSRYLESAAHVQVASPSFSSWGDGGYSSFWLNGTNDWIYPHLHEMAWRMEELARDFPEPTALVRRALNQAARELLLGQSSDWAFSMTTGAHAEYAVARIRSHVVAFLDLDRQIR